MIDMGKTAHMQAERFDINLREIQTLLCTHSHKDHLNTHTLWTRIAVFTALPRLNMFGNAQVNKALLSNERYDGESWRMDFTVVEPYKKYDAGDLGFFTLNGNHGDGACRSINYIITRKNRTFAFLSDTGYPFIETLEALKAYRYDFVIVEGTSGLAEYGGSHMNLEKNIELFDFFNANNLWKSAPDYYITHMAPHWCPPHDDYAPIVESHGMKLAYDGLVIDYPY